jgi:hypothetical protein
MSIQITNTEVYGLSHSLRAMRNALESWDKSDSFIDYSNPIKGRNFISGEHPNLGPNDLSLALKLIKAGPSHRKFLRSICVWCDITIPRYVYTELDTYKISTVRNSCSTMHKLGHRDLTPDDFSEQDVMPEVLAKLNELGKLYRETKEYDYVKQMKRILPEGFMQTSSYNTNYETLLNMYKQRKDHRLDEWRVTDNNEVSICNWIRSLPYMAEFIGAAER